MALYKYVKKQNKRSVLSKKNVPRKYLVLFSGGFLLIGLFLIGQVAYPLLSWYVFTLPGYRATIVSPLPNSFSDKTLVLGSNTISKVESYDVNKWFVGASPKSQTPGTTGLKVYNLSIPKLGIDQATVEVGSMDLKKSLIGWPTSPLPGQYGNNIIFGHSELPQFASPKDYAGIFTHLMDLSIGDEIFVDYDGVRFRYEVIDKSVVEPTNLSVLEQRFDFAYITLITCVPPGTVWQRGIIKGKLADI